MIYEELYVVFIYVTIFLVLMFKKHFSNLLSRDTVIISFEKRKQNCFYYSVVIILKFYSFHGRIRV